MNQKNVPTIMGTEHHKNTKENTNPPPKPPPIGPPSRTEAILQVCDYVARGFLYKQLSLLMNSGRCQRPR
ncbi:MAG: hypothetical protein KDE51_23650, partial [Anaerolineales bacterium]|nr:hypothetical protein [Anaerolineales bacterium]